MAQVKAHLSARVDRSLTSVNVYVYYRKAEHETGKATTSLFFSSFSGAADEWDKKKLAPRADVLHLRPAQRSLRVFELQRSKKINKKKTFKEEKNKSVRAPSTQ